MPERNGQPAPTALRRAVPAGLSAYAQASKRPLYVLVFLLPGVLAFQYGAWRYLAGAEPGGATMIRAHQMLLRFFDAFGAVGFLLPAIALVVVLLLWHGLNRDRWSIDPRVLLLMAAESVAWALPLLVFSAIVHGVMSSGPMPAAGAVELWQMPWQGRATIAVGAGLYEEFLFRMVGIALVHLVVVDLLKASEPRGRIVAIVVTALAFAAYHDVSPNGSLDVVRAGFFTGAGVYFGWLYLSRGFGIVVAAHAVYDLSVLVLFARLGSG